MNYFPFHIGDYASATRHLSWEEDCAFRRLLDVYYTTERPLPLEAKQACRLVLATTETQRDAVASVLQEFFEPTEEGWVNRRADVEIDAMREKQQKQRDKANKRWHKPETEPGIASALPRHKQSNAAASKNDADAMPPTPTPTPTPTPVVRERALSRSTPRPDGVTEQTWNDWLQLRKAKKAPVTQTVLDSATREASSIGWSLEQFLVEWVSRGSQGLKAEWLRKDLPNQQPRETDYVRRQREIVEQLAPRLASRAPGGPAPHPDFIDMEDSDGPARILG